jgi:hypothetical protein
MVVSDGLGHLQLVNLNAGKNLLKSAFCNDLSKVLNGKTAHPFIILDCVKDSDGKIHIVTQASQEWKREKARELKYCLNIVVFEPVSKVIKNTPTDSQKG